MSGGRVKLTGGDSSAALFLSIVVFIGVSEVKGSDRANIRGMGMSRTSVAVARGLDAVGINPANLALPDGGVMSITILPVGAYVTSDFLTYSLYSKYLDSGPPIADLADADKQAILNSFQSPIGGSNAEVIARLFGITLRTDPDRSMAFTVDYGLMGAATIPREYVRLLLFGNVSGASFNVNGLAIQSYWARTYTLSYGSQLPKPEFLKWFAGGVGLKLVQGYGYFEVERFSASLQSAADGTLSGPVSWLARRASTDISDPLGDLFQNPAGYGLGVDIGIAGGIGESFAFGFSVTDLGWIKWTRDVEELSSDTIATAESPDVFKNVRSLANSVSGGKWRSQAFSTSLPGVLRCGVSVQVNKINASGGFPGELLLAVEYLQGVGTTTPLREQSRLSFGMEYKPVRWLPLRSGLAIGGSTSSQLAFGFGFNFRAFDFDVATEDILLLFNGQNSSTGSVGLGLRFRIL